LFEELLKQARSLKDSLDLRKTEEEIKLEK
jgi:hypothetical protein